MDREKEIAYLMQGAYDLHMHAAPSPFHRVLDDYGLLEEAGRAGMAGIMLKSHYESTIARAILANIHCASCTKAYGGLVLNWPVGGLNPYAVENAMKRGCRIVWMPTRDAKNSLCSGNMPGDFFDRSGISILTETGELRAEVLEILRIARKYDTAVATGHISPEESILLCQEGIRQGNRMVLTHPEFPRTRVDVKTQKQLAALGVYIEKCWYNVAEKECTAQEMADHIRVVGAEHCFMVTDRGQTSREHPVEAMKLFMQTLLDEGITEDEIYVMTHTVPRKVLGEL